MTTRRLKPTMAAHVHRDIVGLLTTRPNQSITDLYLQMTTSLDKDLVQGVVGKMRQLGQIYPSGEYRSDGRYLPKYSMGPDGPFTFCEERHDARKVARKAETAASVKTSIARSVDVSKIGVIPELPPKKRERMFKSTRDEVEPVIPKTPSNWLTALGVK